MGAGSKSSKYTQCKRIAAKVHAPVSLSGRAGRAAASGSAGALRWQIKSESNAPYRQQSAHFTGLAAHVSAQYEADSAGKK